ncbi:hypothetical protein [Roseomonas harenae]|uniref:hypothetical protein n=1 Tax=Muricoccus harenae TaxID=2692566 RepID=UPI00133166B1|nr:hypothetical protein [Roseomonas harenae]
MTSISCHSSFASGRSAAASMGMPKYAFPPLVDDQRPTLRRHALAVRNEAGWRPAVHAVQQQAKLPKQPARKRKRPSLIGVAAQQGGQHRDVIAKRRLVWGHGAEQHSIRAGLQLRLPHGVHAVPGHHDPAAVALEEIDATGLHGPGLPA